MSGDSIANARAAAIAILDKLAPDDSVNVIAFDDKVEHLYTEPHVISEDVKRDVKRYIGTIDARGGTDIALALKEAFKVQKHDDHPDCDFVFDGRRIRRTLRDRRSAKRTSSARVFTVGIGAASTRRSSRGSRKFDTDDSRSFRTFTPSLRNFRACSPSFKRRC